jgi:hypothetical protein
VDTDQPPDVALQSSYLPCHCAGIVEESPAWPVLKQSSELDNNLRTLVDSGLLNTKEAFCAMLEG